MRHALTLAILLATAAPAWAKDLEVGPGRTYATIEAAVAAARPGDRIVVAAGVYEESIRTETPGLTFLARGAVVWDGGGGGKRVIPLASCLSVTGDDVVVQGFRFRGGAAHVVIEGANARIRSCTSEAPANGAFGVLGSGARIERCTVRGAQGASIQVAGSHALVARNRIVGGNAVAIMIDGDGAVVRGNTLSEIDGGGVSVAGDDASAVSNTVAHVGGPGIQVQGTGALVRSNRVSHAAEVALAVLGDVAHVENNTVLDVHSAGLYVVGGSMSVVGNRVDQALGPWQATAFFLASQGDSPGGRVERNTASDAAGGGFVLLTRGARCTGNRATRCGSRSEAAFRIEGGGNDLTACVAAGGGHTGFEIRGEDNSLTRCTARENDGDGFQVFAAGNTLTDCVATGNTTHGIVNLGEETSLVRGRFTGNGLDVCRGDPASWDAFDRPVFETGGKYELPLYEE